MRAALVILTFATVAHATLKGVLAPIRTTLGAATVPLETAALPQFSAWIIAAAAALAAWRFADSRRDLLLGALIGLLVPAAWVGTGICAL